VLHALPSVIDVPDAPREDARTAALALVQHLRCARELLRSAVVTLTPSVAADLHDAASELAGELRQRGARRA
jgi:hypothetical protein